MPFFPTFFLVLKHVFRLWFHACNLLYVTSPQKQVTDVSLVLNDSDMDSENLSSLIRLSVSDGPKTDSSKVVSVQRCMHTGPPNLYTCDAYGTVHDGH